MYEAEHDAKGSTIAVMLGPKVHLNSPQVEIAAPDQSGLLATMALAPTTAKTYRRFFTKAARNKI
jgi:hypothetical protein